MAHTHRPWHNHTHTHMHAPWQRHTHTPAHTHTLYVLFKRIGIKEFLSLFVLQMGRLRRRPDAKVVTSQYYKVLLHSVLYISGHKLHVINLNQQSDSVDLLGGWVHTVSFICTHTVWYRFFFLNWHFIFNQFEVAVQSIIKIWWWTQIQSKQLYKDCVTCCATLWE